MNRHELILRAARTCMIEKGFHNASIKNIAACANVSAGLIYRYFENKDSIIEALVTDIVNNMRSHINDKPGHDENQPLDIFQESAFWADLQDNIFMLMDIASVATRSARYKKLVAEAHKALQDDIVQREKQQHPTVDESIIRTRHYVISMLLDGVIVQCGRKGYVIDNELRQMINAILHKLVHAK
ncbi:transcriptional regulator, TetR family [Kosakonia sacchari]|nr:transcriptional regulator, TetR family [Kosakonia sacchari]